MPAHKKHFCKNGHARTPDNVKSNRGCKQCAKKQPRAPYVYTKKIKKQKREYHMANREHINKRTKAWRITNKAYTQGFDVQRTYSISFDEYVRRLEAQNSVCAICRRVLKLEQGKSRAQLDHDHSTGKLRDFLCKCCNLSLGGFQDSILVLESAIEYLKRHKNENNN